MGIFIHASMKSQHGNKFSHGTQTPGRLGKALPLCRSFAMSTTISIGHVKASANIHSPHSATPQVLRMVGLSAAVALLLLAYRCNSICLHILT